VRVPVGVDVRRGARGPSSGRSRTHGSSISSPSDRTIQALLAEQARLENEITRLRAAWTWKADARCCGRRGPSGNVAKPASCSQRRDDAIVVVPWI
jgi:hypothetical protein